MKSFANGKMSPQLEGVSVGSWLSLGSPYVAEIMARAGFSVAAEAARRSLPHVCAQFRSRFSPYHDYQDVRLIRRRIRRTRIADG